MQGRGEPTTSLIWGTIFPTGFVGKVRDALTEHGYEVRVKNGIPTSRKIPAFSKNYLYTITLRDEQMQAMTKLLSVYSGRVQIPTGVGKSAVIAGVAKALACEGKKVLVVTSRAGLVKQTANDLRTFIGDDVSIGQFGDGKKEIRDITVATGQALCGFKQRIRRKNGIEHEVPPDPKVEQLRQETDVLIFDECQHVGSATWFDFAMTCNARHRYGLSGTVMARQDLADGRMEGAAGPLLMSVATQDMVEAGRLKRPIIAAVCSNNASGPEFAKVRSFVTDPITKRSYPVMRSVDYKTAYEQGVVSNDVHNRSMVFAAAWMIHHKRRPLMICRRGIQFDSLCTLAKRAKLRFASMDGNMPTSMRDAYKAEFSAGDIDLIISSTIFDEGENLPAIDALVLAEGVKKYSNFLQRLGRALRVVKGGPKCAWILDSIMPIHPTLFAHGIERVKTAEEEGHEVHLVEDWPEIPTNWPGVKLDYGVLELPFFV
jgi:superfamily II DNA or RNA helicase